MLLLEHDAKTLLAWFGIPVPPGHLVGRHDPTGIEVPGPWVVKAQVPVGGRGKAGGVRTASTPDELRRQLDAVLGMTIKGHVVTSCRVEQQVAGEEAYLSLSVDPAGAGVRLLLAAQGGVEIESLHAQGGVRSALAAPDWASVRVAFCELADELPAEQYEPMMEAARRLAAAFFRFEATLLEINPLFLLPDGGWIAGDAKMILDGNAMPRQVEIEELARERRDAYPEVVLKLEHGFDYVEIDAGGHVGMVTTGAGLSMMLMDELTTRGLRPFNFCDIRTGQMRGDPRRLIEVLTWIARGPGIRVVLASVFAGITHLGEFAELLVQAMRAVPEFRVPVVARIIGNGFADAERIIAAAGLPIIVEPDLDRAIDAAARIVRG